MLLAIDTSAGTTVAIVDRDRGIIAERSSDDTRSHAELIGSYIAQCLDESGVAIRDLSAVAVGMGPGPFTGLRVGIAAAQAFALGAGRPVMRLVSHDAVAFDLFSSGHTGPLLVVTDARRREVYWSAYGGADATGLPVRDAEPGLTRPDDLCTAVPRFGDYTRVDAARIPGGALGMLAETMFANGRTFAGPGALYLRPPDAIASAGPKRVS